LEKKIIEDVVVVDVVAVDAVDDAQEADKLADASLTARWTRSRVRRGRRWITE
jgi:hypothetical protein